MKDYGNQECQDGGTGCSRRRFLLGSRNVVLGTVVGSSLSGMFWLDDAVAAIPASEGYLLVDTKKCQGCASCMLACSLVHEGVESLSLARIQVLQNPFEKWPQDVSIEQCRQCVEPKCVEVCPKKAITVDAAHGNVRQVDEKKCIGCGMCVQACPFTPSRPVVAPDSKFEGKKKARKCDLCARAAYHWDDAGGGPRGKQACVEFCPLGAIRFTADVPVQEGDAGYDVNLRLRDVRWQNGGFPID
jgi:protein NrfC